jgi:hypothetical protein
MEELIENTAVVVAVRAIVMPFSFPFSVSFPFPFPVLISLPLFCGLSPELAAPPPS